MSVFCIPVRPENEGWGEVHRMRVKEKEDFAPKCLLESPVDQKYVRQFSINIIKGPVYYWTASLILKQTVEKWRIKGFQL